MMFYSSSLNGKTVSIIDREIVACILIAVHIRRAIGA